MYGDKIVLLDGAGTGSNAAATNGLLSLIPSMFANAFGGNRMDPNLVAALMNGRNNQDAWGGSGCWWMWIILLFFMWGGRGFGNAFGGGEGACAGIPAQLNNATGRELLMQAIQGNRSAIDQIASALNCTSQQLQSSLCNIQGAIDKVAGQVGMTSQGVINAVQSTGCQIGNQIAQCCCNLQSLINQSTCNIQNDVTRQGYENQIATLNQTNQLQGTINNGFTDNRERATNQFNILSAKLDAQNVLMNERFSELEKRQLQETINSLREEKNALQTSALLQQQSRYVIDTVRPCPIPSFNTCNPWGCNGGFYGYGVNGFTAANGFYNGCNNNSCCTNNNSCCNA